MCMDTRELNIADTIYYCKKKQLSKPGLSISTEPIAILIQLLRCQYVSGQPAVRLVSHVVNF